MMIELMIYDRCIWMNEYISNVNGAYAINEWIEWNEWIMWMNYCEWRNDIRNMIMIWFDNDMIDYDIDLEWCRWFGNDWMIENPSLFGIFWWNNAKQGGLSEHQTDNWW